MSTYKRTPRRWAPPHCPNPHCPFHHAADNWRFRRAGYFKRLTPPYRVPRFQCHHCRKSFSRQTFSTTYYLKRPDLLHKILLLTVGGMANRQIARALDCAPATVDLLLSKLGRHCLLLHRQLMEKASPAVNIVADGLETFEWSQYFPFEHLIAIDKDNSFILHFTDAPLRRKGHHREDQLQRRAELEERHGRPDPKAIRKGMQEVFEEAMRGAESVTLYTDKHLSYPPALRAVDCDVTHRRISSKKHRDKRNRLFEVNSFDRFLRHSSANHTRETLAWSKRRQCSSERFAVLSVWKNCMKRRWENGPLQTPAMLKGLLDRPWKVADILRERLFVSHFDLPARWREYYFGLVETPVVGRNRRHELKNAV